MAKGKAGNKDKYDYEDPMFLVQLEGWARDGYDDKQIAEMLDLAPETFSRKKNSIESIKSSLMRGRRPLEVLVENSLFSRARGVKVTKTTVIKKREWNPASQKHEINVYESTEVTELPPDVKAQELWLRNRKPEKWNTKQGIDHTTNGKDVQGVQLVFADTPLSEADLEEIRAIKEGKPFYADGNEEAGTDTSISEA